MALPIEAEFNGKGPHGDDEERVKLLEEKDSKESSSAEILDNDGAPSPNEAAAIKLK